MMQDKSKQLKSQRPIFLLFFFKLTRAFIERASVLPHKYTAGIVNTPTDSQTCFSRALPQHSSTARGHEPQGVKGRIPDLLRFSRSCVLVKVCNITESGKISKEICKASIDPDERAAVM